MTAKELNHMNPPNRLEIPSLQTRVSKMRMMMYAAATWNPYQLHWDSDYAKAHGFPDANIAGPMFGDYLAEMLVRWAGNPALLKSLEYTNRAMAFPEDTLTCKGKVEEKLKEGENILLRCHVWVENQEGRILAEGKAVLSFA
jgi:hydroxyacyl-ACP dehydratase HTD2-like protein with hotdog domain